MLDGRPLWTCPGCGRTFARPNQTHTCVPLGSVDAHFAGRAPAVRETFDAVLAAVRACGPVDVLAERTRIALHVRMCFAAFMPRRRWLDGHLVLVRRIDSPRFRRVEVYSPRNVLHAFRLAGPGEVDDEFMNADSWPRSVLTLRSSRPPPCGLARPSACSRVSDDHRVPSRVTRRPG